LYNHSRIKKAHNQDDQGHLYSVVVIVYMYFTNFVIQ
jgi:hypothetical protein